MTESELADRARDYTEAVEWRRGMRAHVKRMTIDLQEAEAKLVAANEDVNRTREALDKAVKGEL